MKILLDENIPAKLKFDFRKGYEVYTVGEMNWQGKKNGELLGLATFNGFEVFITLDKNLKNQQNLSKFEIKFILLLSKNNKHQTLQPYIQKIKKLQNADNLPNFNEISD
jgi:predicted nuclease of predicted toxin-antitoxin system